MYKTLIRKSTNSYIIPVRDDTGKIIFVEGNVPYIFPLSSTIENSFEHLTLMFGCAPEMVDIGLTMIDLKRTEGELAAYIYLEAHHHLSASKSGELMRDTRIEISPVKNTEDINLLANLLYIMLDKNDGMFKLMKQVIDFYTKDKNN